VTIISSDTPFKSQSLQRLHEQLRHEMFHLWIPNGVKLTGNYDWFYEGFALYQSLKMGVGVNRLRFEDYLDTLSRAYDIDRLSGSKLSLIDASKNRWNGNNNTQVYARGMLVAFLCDLALLDASNGKRSTETIVREIYSRYRPPSLEMDGNEVVLARLRSSKELVPIIDAYITGTDSIKLAEHLKVAGIEPANDSGPTSLRIAAKPADRQKNLLDKLGYNSWRKLSSSNK
jgi:predicted metalloprotease with PDZ domain